MFPAYAATVMIVVTSTSEQQEMMKSKITFESQ